MTEKINRIKNYIGNGTVGYFFDVFNDNNIVLWVDHRDFDNDIINGIESILQTGYLKGEWIDETDDKMGFEIIIHYKGEKHKIVYEDENCNRDAAIFFLNKVLLPNYEIRFCKDSLGGDTLAFLPLSATQWNELENEFGNKKINLLFMKVTSESKMFEMDEVFVLLEKRKKIKETEFGIIEIEE